MSLLLSSICLVIRRTETREKAVLLYYIFVDQIRLDLMALVFLDIEFLEFLEITIRFNTELVKLFAEPVGCVRPFKIRPTMHVLCADK